MQLTFESLAELQDFVQWIGALTPIKTVTVGDVSVSAPAADPIFREVLTDETVEDAAPAAKTVTGRKRRTKAEMEAARAAESGSGETSAATAAAEQPAISATTSAAVAESASIPAVDNVARERHPMPDSMQDAVSFIKSRLVERPEVSQVEHLNLARTFIGKHGMEKYNSSFPLAGLTPNVMGYSPADCATHAAALDFLSLE